MDRNRLHLMLEQLEAEYQQRRHVLLREAERRCDEGLKSAGRSLALGETLESLSHLAEAEKALQSMRKFVYQVTDHAVRQEYELSMTRLNGAGTSIKNLVTPDRRSLAA